MKTILNIQKRLLPDLMEVMQKRYQILHYIKFLQPVGRRTLALNLNLTERVVRSEVEFLKEQHLVDIHSSGMRLTSVGLHTLEQLESIMREISGVDTLEKKLMHKLQVENIIIVPGNSDTSPWVKAELGKAGAECIKKFLTGENIIAVTGGTTMASVAEMLTPIPASNNLLFVPARGGLGEEVQNQANTIVAKMADKMNSEYRLLFVPDQVSDESYTTLTKEPSIKEVLSLINSSDIVVHGIGEASTMAKRRNTSDANMKKIENGHAVGEAFGYYFNEEGEIVHKVQTIGFQLEHLERLETEKHFIAVAGGQSKAKAIQAYMKLAPRKTTLIIDEAVATQLLKG